MTTQTMVTATLVTEGPLAIHTGERGIRSDLVVLVDQRGRPYLPGTALAGAIRAGSRRVGSIDTDVVFGTIEVDDDTLTERLGVPSRVTVHDAPYVGPGAPTPDIRPHVGIDRATLAAKQGVLFDEETWPCGLQFQLRLEVPGDDLADVLAALDDLASPRGGLGGGACPVRIDDLRAVGTATSVARALDDAEARWDDAGAADWPDGPVRDVPGPTPSPADATEWIDIRLDAVLDAPLAVRVPLDRSTGHDRDNVPFTVSRIDAKGEQQRTPAVPGSAMKGRLRQRAEYWCASAGLPAPDPWNPDPHDHHAVTSAFGRAPAGRDDAGGAAGSVRCHDWLCDEWFAGDADQHPVVVTVDRVALDRLTGSTFQSAKFQDTVVRAGTALTGRITIAPPDGSCVDDLDVALVVAGLRDLAHGVIGVGGGTRSGYGSIRIRGGTITERTNGRVREVSIGEDLVLPEAWSERVATAWQRYRMEESA